MIGNKKIIGLCVTRIQSIQITEYLARLHKRAKTEDYKLMVFNSAVDFYYNDNNDEGAKSVYSLINHEILDVLIVYADNFKNEELFLGIVDDAKAHNVPVIVLKGEADGCYNIVTSYEDGFKELMRHVIRDHGVTDTMMIAGRNDDEDPESVRRIKCYREVLEDCGLPFSDELVEYGEYWSVPTQEAMKRIREKRNGYPGAIFCTNDYMAISVCKILKEEGLSVPDDVIVTGFDGIPEAEYLIPQLSTCKENIDNFASLTIDIIKGILDGTAKPGLYYDEFNPFLTESCGCGYRGSGPREEAERQFSLVHNTLASEEFVFGWLSQVMEIVDMTSFMELMPKIVLSLGYLCLNSDALSRIEENDHEPKAFPFTDTVNVINSYYAPEPLIRKSFTRRQLLPAPRRWAERENDTICVISSVYSGSEVFGYYAVCSGNIELDSNAINRTSNSINIAFNSILNYYRQRNMLLGLKNAAITDHLTGLPNLKGTTKWFDDFSAIAGNHDRCLTISVYGLPKYKYIYENFGIAEIEESVRFIADALRRSNPRDCMIGRVSEDEFLVINYFDSPEEIAPTINAATTCFYGYMTEFNGSGKKKYHLEVNAGCTELFPGWEGTLESFSKLASNSMYLNRLSGNVEPVVKTVKMPVESYKSFELLIDQNLFDYHFQPIVAAKTGEIIAYEALMRPHKSIGMNPMEVIRTAEEYGRLADIEKATMFNVLKKVSDNYESFKGRRIFINSVPGYFLQGEDYARFINEYKDYLGNMVIEITEGSTVSDDELRLIKGINNGAVPIAIDDYGTGHSNIVNLLRYSPQVIKIDRFLITEIQNDTNKQLFFKSTVEFAELNGMKVLAEGVETAEELECVIKLGADLIQGYYTGRPAPMPLDEIDKDIREAIIKTANNL